VGNNTAMTRTMGRLPLLIDKEITEGPDVHLAQTPITMGNPAGIRSEIDVYADVLRKLEWGNLYFYYGEGTLTHPSLPQQMYPITVQEVRRGVVVGRERLVTLRSGVYGWPGSAGLHQAWRYDARGYPVPHTFLTTVDAAGARTEIALAKDESAALRRLPVDLETKAPVNAWVECYDASGLRLRLNGTGAARLRVAETAFGAVPAGAFSVRVGEPLRPVPAVEGFLVVDLALAGPVSVQIAPPR